MKNVDTPSEPGPSRVVVLDLEAPTPELTADDRYQSAMIVGRQNGVPYAAIDIDLLSDSVAGQLESLRAAAPPAPPPDAAISDDRLPAISVVIPTIVARTEDLALLLEGFSRSNTRTSNSSSWTTAGSFRPPIHSQG